MNKSPNVLERFSASATNWSGSSVAFAIAVVAILVWAATGPVFGYSDTWQLVINTSTTIITFLMVFLIQRSQNKESLAVQVKLNELLAAVSGASNRLINLEDQSEDDVKQLHDRFRHLTDRIDGVSDATKAHSVEECRESAKDRESQSQTAAASERGKLPIGS